MASFMNTVYLDVLWEMCSNIPFRNDSQGTVISANLNTLKWTLSIDYFAASVECVIYFKQPKQICPDFHSFQVQCAFKTIPERIQTGTGIFKFIYFFALFFPRYV